MAPRHDFAGTGVPAPDGYTASTDAMSASGRAITVAAEDARTDIDDLQPTPLSEADFGTAHTEHFAAYSAAIEQLGAGAQAMCANGIAFAGQLGGASRSYAAAEQAAVQTISTSGVEL